MNRATLDIDIGGTFTDCVLTWGGRQYFSKVDTTGYDLSVGFERAVEAAADAAGISVEELLQNTTVIRYSTTVALNRLLERTGPRLGMLVTRGFEDVIYIGRASQWMDGLLASQIRNVARIERPAPLVERGMVIGIPERIDAAGHVVSPLDEDAVRDAVRRLIDRGARAFVISLLNAYRNPQHELRVKAIIQEEYPPTLLGSTPILCSSEVLPKLGEYPRTMTTVLNAYLHQVMADDLAQTRDRLRERGYHGPLMLIHNTGGMAELTKTAAIDTFNGGPIAGLMGTIHMAQVYGLTNVVAADMGGTSFDISILVGGSARLHDYRPVIDRWLVGVTMLANRSIGAGGGSIAWVNPLLGHRLEVGPQSAGSHPGPAAYAQGGQHPTVTDADLVLGLLSADHFHGGRRRLDVERARRAIQREVAEPLGTSVEEAALLIRKIVDANMGEAIRKETAMRGYDPRQFTCFAFGGAGPTHACGFARAAGIRQIIVVPEAPVFCAWGSNTMAVLHIYEISRHIPLLRPGGELHDDFTAFAEALAELKERARRDFVAEGYDPDRLAYALELEMRYGGQLDTLRVTSPVLSLGTPEDAKTLYQHFEQEYAETFSALSVYPQGGVDIETLILRAWIPADPPTVPEAPEVPHAIEPVGERPALFQIERGYQSTPVYRIEQLTPGVTLEGPAIVEADDTTIVLEPGFHLAVNRFGHAVISDTV
ncbi:MAG: hydantoinase/oxoprolinase family protein [Firmicutes bacterium]|nr:hydantoinase/oxoprolinase family protein [Alicyclobacillaceae bacterium]MCL6498382.1 hydantoinase/oxoprolinase family protein [Bacillota bacterium]